VRAPGLLLHHGLTVRRARLPHGGPFRARACTTIGILRHPRKTVPCLKISQDPRREDTNVSRARPDRARSRLAHEVDASDPGDFSPRARSTGAPAPPRAMLTSFSCFPSPGALAGKTKIDTGRLGEETPQRSTQRRLVFSARRPHEQLGEGGRGRAGCSSSLRRPRLDEADPRRKRRSFVEARVRERARAREAPFWSRARVARRARGW
jgi:hypothetical protein